jgi:hypothetical protein
MSSRVNAFRIQRMRKDEPRDLDCFEAQFRLGRASVYDVHSPERAGMETSPPV